MNNITFHSRMEMEDPNENDFHTSSMLLPTTADAIKPSEINRDKQSFQQFRTYSYVFSIFSLDRPIHSSTYPMMSH